MWVPTAEWGATMLLDDRARCIDQYTGLPFIPASEVWLDFGERGCARPIAMQQELLSRDLP